MTQDTLPPACSSCFHTLSFHYQITMDPFNEPQPIDDEYNPLDELKDELGITPEHLNGNFSLRQAHKS